MELKRRLTRPAAMNCTRSYNHGDGSFDYKKPAASVTVTMAAVCSWWSV
jgi:hypothetical protein